MSLPGRPISAVAAQASKRRKLEESTTPQAALEDFNDPRALHGHDTANGDGTENARESVGPLPPSNDPASRWSLDLAHAGQKIGASYMVIVLKPGQHLTLIGECDLKVLKGAVRLFGITRTPQDEPFTIYAPSVQALPAIKCFDDLEAEIKLSSRKHPMSKLSAVWPLLGSFWYRPYLDSSAESAAGAQTTFTFVPQDGILLNDKRFLCRLSEPRSWEELGDSVLQGSQSNRPAPRVLLCGQNLAGKSTCARYVTNKLLSKRVARVDGIPQFTEPPVLNIFWLDLDPRKPEFSPPGQISLVLVKKPICGPSFTHSHHRNSDAYEIIRAHCVAEDRIEGDEDFFWQAVEDLLACHETQVQKSGASPMIVHCPGYRSSDRFETGHLEECLQRISATDVAFIGEIKLPGPTRRLENLLSQLKNDTRLWHLQKAPEHVRKLDLGHKLMGQIQTMSYFHASDSNAGLEWAIQPAVALPKWTLRYDESNADILGIVTVKAHPPQYQNVRNDLFLQNMVVGICLLDSEQDAAVASSKISRPAPDEMPYLTNFHHTHKYRPPPNSSSLIGWGLVLDIDSNRRTTTLVTPLLPKTKTALLERATHPKIILLRGRLDHPIWPLNASMESALSRGNVQEDSGLELQTVDLGDPASAKRWDEGYDRFMGFEKIEKGAVAGSWTGHFGHLGQTLRRKGRR